MKGARRREDVQEYDRATTPHRRAEARSTISAEDKAILADTHASINPAAVQRRVQALTAELLRPHHHQGRAEDQGTNRRTLYARILRCVNDSDFARILT